MTSRMRSLFWTRVHQGEALAQVGPPHAMYTCLFMCCLKWEGHCIDVATSALWIHPFYFSAWSFSHVPLPANTSSRAYTPCRFYIMRLPSRGVAFDRITYHAQVTQCLGSLGEQPWFLAVAEPSGSVEAWPQLSDLHAFRCAS